jgi:hypothetical protein
MRAPVRGDDRGAQLFSGASAVLVVPPTATPVVVVPAVVVPAVVVPTVPPPVVTPDLTRGEVIPSHGCCPLLQIRTQRPNTLQTLCNRDNLDHCKIPRLRQVVAAFTRREDSIFR